MRHASTMALLLLSSCAGFPVADEEISQLSSEDLLRQINSPSARDSNYLGFDGAYREKLIRELAKKEAWDENTTVSVIGRKVWIGQTTRQLAASWGWPRDKTESVSRFGTHATWYYGTYNSTTHAVNISDGIVSGWTTL